DGDSPGTAGALEDVLVFLSRRGGTRKAVVKIRIVVTTVTNRRRERPFEKWKREHERRKLGRHHGALEIGGLIRVAGHVTGRTEGDPLRKRQHGRIKLHES